MKNTPAIVAKCLGTILVLGPAAGPRTAWAHRLGMPGRAPDSIGSDCRARGAATSHMQHPLGLRRTSDDNPQATFMAVA